MTITGGTGLRWVLTAAGRPKGTGSTGITGGSPPVTARLTGNGGTIIDEPRTASAVDL
jgi:hypothetical protein